MQEDMLEYGDTVEKHQNLKARFVGEARTESDAEIRETKLALAREKSLLIREQRRAVGYYAHQNEA